MIYDEFAARLVAGGILSDPWIDGAPRFRPEPIIVSARLADAMYRASEDVAAVYNEMCLLVADEPRFLDDFFMLTPFQKVMWTASQPHWHGIARADVFVTAAGGLCLCGAVLLGWALHPLRRVEAVRPGAPA